MCESTEKLLQQEKELSLTLIESLQMRESDTFILGMKKQLIKIRDYLTANKRQVSTSRIWKSLISETHCMKNIIQIRMIL